MSTMSLELPIDHRHRVSHWNRLRQSIIEWRQRARSRRELSNLDDFGLQDIGMTRSVAEAEACKAFWMG
jgi:uncharacterized protein YjiS (DUF1127 family)